jgi:hypothetical protein
MTQKPKAVNKPKAVDDAEAYESQRECTRVGISVGNAD